MGCINTKKAEIKEIKVQETEVIENSPFMQKRSGVNMNQADDGGQFQTRNRKETGNEAIGKANRGPESLIPSRYSSRNNSFG